MNKTSIKAPNGEVNWDDLILNLVVASVIIFIILIPRFFFRVSKEDYEKFKKEHKEQQAKLIKEKIDDMLLTDYQEKNTQKKKEF